MTNILQETLTESYAEFEEKAQGGYGSLLKELVDGIFTSCECDAPFIDLEAQMEALSQDLEILQDVLKQRLTEKLSPSNAL